MRHRGVQWAAGFWAISLSLICHGAEPQDILQFEPQADVVLRQMSDYLASLKEFSVKGVNRWEQKVVTGQTVPLTETFEIYVRRPNRVKATVRGELRDQDIYYDGQTVTLFTPDTNTYASIDQVPDIDAAVLHAVRGLALRAPLGRLLLSDFYQVLKKNALSGRYLGVEEVDGVACRHVAVTTAEVDWQLWVEDGVTPLPRKLVAKYRGVAVSPELISLLTDWDTAVSLSDSLFQFVPPPDASKVDYLPKGSQ